MLITMGLGCIITWRKHIKDGDKAFLNALCFKYLLPINMFYSTLAIDFYAEFNLRMVLFCIISIFCIALAAWIFFSFTIKDIERRCLFIMGAFRSNNIIFALPLSTNLFGQQGVKAATMLMPITIIMFNLFAVITFVYHSTQNKTSLLGALKNTLIEIIKNPLIVGSALGIVFSLLRFNLPRPLLSGIGNIAQIATPLALLLLGSQIDIKQLGGNLKAVLAACSVRLIVVPAIMTPICIKMGFRSSELGALVIAFSAPCAVAHMVMARNYNIDPPFASQMVYLSTVLSLLTIFIIISLLRSFGFI